MPRREGTVVASIAEKGSITVSTTPNTNLRARAIVYPASLAILKIALPSQTSIYAQIDQGLLMK
jgi:hypothetical protein